MITRTTLRRVIVRCSSTTPAAAPTGSCRDPLPNGMNNKGASAYDDVKAGKIASRDTYRGRENPWWTGVKEYRFPGRRDNERILEKEFPNGVKVYVWLMLNCEDIKSMSHLVSFL